MSVFFRERCGDSKEFLELEGMGISPLFELFKDMLMIDVYFIAGMVKGELLGQVPSPEIMQLEIDIGDEEFKNCQKRKRNKKINRDQKLLVEHYEGILDRGEDINNVLEAIGDVEATVGEVLIFLFITRARILCHLDNSINLPLAFSKIAKNELKRRGATDTEIQKRFNELEKELDSLD